MILLVVGVLIATGVASGSHPKRWPGRTISYWAEPRVADTAYLAASRWNAAGVGMRFVRVNDRHDAEVVIRRDRAYLDAKCGGDCLGWTTSIGLPESGRTTVTLRPEATDALSPLGVWVTVHELGHVLGLRHRPGSSSCTVMQAQAFKGRCQPNAFAGEPLAPQLGCIPAPADVDAAASIYGRRTIRSDAAGPSRPGCRPR